MPYNIPTWSAGDGSLTSLARLRGSKYPIIDAHLHVVDFAQETPGAECLLHYMDQANIPKAVIYGLPVTKQFGATERAVPHYYMDNDAPCYYYGYTDVLVAEFVRSAPAEQRHRFYPLVCGLNPTDKFAIRHVERLFEQYPDVWHGIGELLLRHDDLTALTQGEAARANHPGLFPIYEFAADRGLPIMVHQNVTSVTKSDHPIYLWELEEALSHFPRTKFVFAHCGMSRRVEVPLYWQMMERMLGQYENLSVDYAWIVFDSLVCPGGRPDPIWVALTEKFSDRICLGSDLVTRFERLGPEMQRFDPLLDALSEETRRKITIDNAERLWGTPAAARPPRHPPDWEQVLTAQARRRNGRGG